jgi:hypothetical protein
MAFFDDYTNAIEQYPDDHTTVEIVNVSVPGTALNVGETGTFDVRLSNTGPLLMADVTVKIKGLNGVTVKDSGATAPFVTEFVTGVGAFPIVPAHNAGTSENSGTYSFRAPNTAMAVTDLIEVSLEDWTADFDHVHESHANGSAAVRTTHRDRVRAS